MNKFKLKMKYLWYSNKVATKSPDTIHQVLMFGNLGDIQSLKKAIGEETIRKLFLHYPKKIYTAPALNFIKNFILRIGTSIDEQQYLKHTPRHIR